MSYAFIKKEKKTVGLREMYSPTKPKTKAKHSVKNKKKLQETNREVMNCHINLPIWTIFLLDENGIWSNGDVVFGIILQTELVSNENILKENGNENNTSIQNQEEEVENSRIYKEERGLGEYNTHKTK